VNKFVILVGIYSVFVIAVITVILVLNGEKKIDIVQGEENAKYLDSVLEASAHTDKHNEDGYHQNDELVAIFTDVEQTLGFFVSVLKEENEEYFASLFLPQQYSDDLWASSKDPFKDKITKKFMKELNRNGMLESARYDTKLMDGYKTNRKDSAVELILVYKDGKEAKLSLDLELMGTEHSKDDDIYFIKNSVLDLINHVKKQTK
jgi:hypothetical protein